MAKGNRLSRPLLALAVIAAAPVSGAPAGPAGRGTAVRLTPATLLGRWGDNGDCGKDVVFRGDGTFRSYTGGEGAWRLAGERLTMTGAHGSFVLIVRLIDRNRLRILNPDGSVGISQRC
jgi:hypothetical protein